MSCDSKTINLAGPPCQPYTTRLTDVEFDCVAAEVTFTQIDILGEDVSFTVPFCQIQDISVDEDNVVTDIDPATKTYTITIPLIDNITLAPAGQFVLDLSVLYDNTNTVSIFSQNVVDGLITHNDGLGTIATAEVTSKDVGNILSTGTDGGTFLEAADLCTMVAATQDLGLVIGGN